MKSLNTGSMIFAETGVSKADINRPSGWLPITRRMQFWEKAFVKEIASNENELAPLSLGDCSVINVTGGG